MIKLDCTFFKEDECIILGAKPTLCEKCQAYKVFEKAEKKEEDESRD